jgi:hypothetical protein
MIRAVIVDALARLNAKPSPSDDEQIAASVLVRLAILWTVQPLHRPVVRAAIWGLIRSYRLPFPFPMLACIF